MYCSRQLFKCTYELFIHHRDEFLTSIMSKDEIRSQIAMEISRKAEVDPDYIIIDVPTVASVPYYPLQKRPSDIPIFQKLPNGNKESHTLSEYSHLVEALIGYIDVVRVYTPAKFREKVREASSEVFGKQPSSAKVSM